LLHVLKEWCNKFLPTTCLLCRQPTKTNQSLCLPCEQELPWLKNTCIQCAYPLETDVYSELRCGTCLSNPPAFESTVSLFHYEQPVTFLVNQLKFNNQLSSALLFGNKLAETIIRSRDPSFKLPQCIVPVALHYKRLRERVYNQALELARPISKRLKIPIDYKSAQRVIHTEPQSNVKAKFRQKNVKNAFSFERSSVTHVAIIDDVMTTGHTVRELSKVLRRSGVKTIEIWCVARTSPGKRLIN